jgi:hypothetical protein
MTAMDLDGVRRFIVDSADRKTPTSSAWLVICILRLVTYTNQSQVWVFTDDLYFSSSASRDLRKDPTRAMKLMWKSIDNPEDMLQRNQSTIEEISVPGTFLETIQDIILKSQHLLPTALRTFQDWRVGLLQKFRAADCR